MTRKPPRLPRRGSRPAELAQPAGTADQVAAFRVGHECPLKSIEFIVRQQFGCLTGEDRGFLESETHAAEYPSMTEGCQIRIVGQNSGSAGRVPRFLGFTAFPRLPPVAAKSAPRGRVALTVIRMGHERREDKICGEPHFTKASPEKCGNPPFCAGWRPSSP